MNSINIHPESNILNLFIMLFCSICPVIPFAIVDVYYSHSYYYVCLDYSSSLSGISSTLTPRIWLMVNGYISISNISLVILLFFALHNNICNWFIQIFQNNIFTKIFIFMKIGFNISWTILGSILFYNVSDICQTNLRVYVWIRISFMFLLTVFSIKNIKQYIIDLEKIGNISETIENNR